LALYQGEEQARRARMQAAGNRFEAQGFRQAGAEAARAGGYRAAGTIFNRGLEGGLFGKYGYPGTRAQDAGTPNLYPYA